MGEEMVHHVAHLGLVHHPAAHRLPHLRHHQAHELLRRVRRLQVLAGRGRVEGDVPGLLLRDALEQRGQRRMVGHRGEPAVGRHGRELVGRAPHHVHGDEVGAGEVGQRGLLERTQRLAPAELDPLGLDLVVVDDDAVALEHLRERLAVPELLAVPHGHEAARLLLAVGGGHQQVPQEAGGVVLDVAHVAQGAQGRRVQRLGLEGVEVEVLVLHGHRGLGELIDVEGHVTLRYEAGRAGGDRGGRARAAAG